MKEYQRRFIQMSMLLIGAVLTSIFVILFFYMRLSTYDQLSLTMREMLEPLSNQDPSMLPQDAEKSQFVTVFVGETGSDDLIVFDLSAEYNEDTLYEVVDEILMQEESFGTLLHQDIIYYRREMSVGYKIAMVDTAYLSAILNRFVFLLVIVWLFAMLAFLCISFHFSKLAIQPLKQARLREKRFVADASHDLKTPLSVIIASNEILLRSENECDTQPGMKHRCTNAAMEYFRSEVMEMCHAAGLHQIDLLNGSKTRVTEREYWAKKKGQLALDRENAALSEQGLPVKQTKFETDKDKLRKEIRRALADAISFEDFAEKLLRCGITVKESRGRLSYLTPDRAKPITARKLGDDFDKAAVFAVLDRNAKKPRLKTALTGEELLQQQNKLSRVVDIEAKVAEGKGQGYVNWAKKHNLKNMSKALLLLEEKGFTSLEELDTAYQVAYDRRSDILAQLKAVETAIDEKKELQRHVLNYVKSRPLRDDFNACKSDKAQHAYRQKHESEFLTMEAAKRFFDRKGLKKLPTPKALQQEIEQLIKDKNRLYNEYQTAKKQTDELYTIRYNLNKALSENPQQKRHSHER